MGSLVFLSVGVLFVGFLVFWFVCMVSFFGSLLKVVSGIVLVVFS